MTALPLLAVKASLVLAVAFGVTFLMRRRSAALRHCVLAVGLFYAAAMPALQWLAPDWTLRDAWSRVRTPFRSLRRRSPLQPPD